MSTGSMKRYKHIIWDWNGTLLDDVNIVVNVMNNLLERRNLPLLDIEKYKDIFTFPVKEYYAQLGFDFNVQSFEELAYEFISEFSSEKYQFRLHPGAEEVLSLINRIGISQSILSASQEQDLTAVINDMNIREYFVRVVGLNNHYAISKVERGIDLLTDLGFEPKDVLLIGDTIHDCEVAKEMGCDCLLICNGHQSYQRISNCRAAIVNTVIDVVDFIKGENSAYAVSFA